MRNFEDLKIAVAGTGYVGLSIATLLSQHHKVMAVDIIPEKVEMINNKKSPIQDEYIEKYLAEKELDLTATLDAKEAYSDADFVVIAAPTNYDSKKNFFDTSAVEAVIKLVIEYNPEAIMVIKSTIPVGYTVIHPVNNTVKYINKLRGHRRDGKLEHQSAYGCLAKICCCVHFNFPHPFDRDCRTCMCSSPCILIIVNFNRYGQKKL